MFEKIKPTLEKDYYLNSNPCFAVEKQLLITYIYPNHVFVEKMSHADLKNGVFNLAEINRIVLCSLNMQAIFSMLSTHWLVKNLSENSAPFENMKYLTKMPKI